MISKELIYGIKRVCEKTGATKEEFKAFLYEMNKITKDDKKYNELIQSIDSIEW